MIGKNIAYKYNYAGIFMVSLATLMYEILITRIFSVTMMYHFAFLAISLALFGMTVGALIVYLMSKFFAQNSVAFYLSLSSLLFALTTVASFVIHLNYPSGGNLSLLFILINFVTISIPFIFSGVSISLALTKFPGHVDRLYASDLIGAALGCIAVIYVLRITDGPTAVIITATIASLGAFFFALNSNNKQLEKITVAVFALLVIFSLFNIYRVNQGSPLLRLKWVKGVREPIPLVEKWNSFSRVRVWENPTYAETPFGWGMSDVYPANFKVNQLYLDIDANAATILTDFNGNLDNLDYLKYDVVNLAHHLRPDSNVLVVGIGGGRDILSALAFHQKSVVGVEINENIINIVTKTYGKFTGNLDKYPNVTFINDEARSYVSRSRENFDIIQVSLIDTWAATASGAFVLTENSLYTIEAWRVFFDHLSSDGLITFSRWYLRDQPGEMYRLTSLANASLDQIGVKNPRNHILIARYFPKQDTGISPIGMGTIIVSKSPLTRESINKLEKIAHELNFELVLTPSRSTDPIFSKIASGDNLEELYNKFPINISPPTDDSPYFFHMLRLRDISNQALWKQGMPNFNMVAVYTLGSLLIIVALLTLLCILIPLILTIRIVNLHNTVHLFIFFLCIGFGFMLVEISQLQRLTVFLGHPSYSLSIVLFSLLLSSGLGSYLTKNIKIQNIKKAILRLSILLGLLMLFGILSPIIVVTFASSVTTIRILVAVGILFPIGLFMGMAFPLGMKLASNQSKTITPWLWGINGASSVFASVLAIAIALSSGISASFWTGFLCYSIALIAFTWGSIRKTI